MEWSATQDTLLMDCAGGGKSRDRVRRVGAEMRGPIVTDITCAYVTDTYPISMAFTQDQLSEDGE
jgi:hypothetical protein